jgi:hypothetical protein
MLKRCMEDEKMPGPVLLQKGSDLVQVKQVVICPYVGVGHQACPSQLNDMTDTSTAWRKPVNFTVMVTRPVQYWESC